MRKKVNTEYDYSPTIYKSCYEKIIIICKKHGTFEQSVGNHLYGMRCLQCGLERRGNLRRLKQKDVEKLFLDNDCKLIDTYINSGKLVKYICKYNKEEFYTYLKNKYPNTKFKYES